MAAAPVQSAASARVIALDNLRVVAMLLGLVIHGVLPYTATGLVGFPIRDRTRHVRRRRVYFAVHDFRMQLFFLLAGFAAAALATRRGNRRAGPQPARPRRAAARPRRPFCLPAHAPAVRAAHGRAAGFGWNAADTGGWVGPNFHLWFLYYLLMCCVPLVALLAAGVHRLPERGSLRGFDRGGALVPGAVVEDPRRGRRWRCRCCGTCRRGGSTRRKGWRAGPCDLRVLPRLLPRRRALFRHRDLLAGVGRRWPLQLVVAEPARPAARCCELTVAGNWAERELRGRIAGLAGRMEGGRDLPRRAVHVADDRRARRPFPALLRRQRRVVEVPRRRVLLVLSGRVPGPGGPTGLAGSEARCPIVAEFLLVNALTFAVLLASYEFCVRHTWVGLMLNGKRPERQARHAPGTGV